MPFVWHFLVWSRGVAICGLALLLLLTPMCGAFCHAQSCPAPKHDSKTSGCHESASAASGGSPNHTIEALRTCNLQDLPAVLPGNFRAPSLRATPFVKSSGRGDSQALLAFTGPLASRLARGETARDNTRGHGLRLDADSSSALILRI